MKVIIVGGGIGGLTTALMLHARGIEATSHYIPLDLTPGGRRFAQAAGSLAVSHAAAARLVRLPLWFGMGALQDEVIHAVLAELG